ncbi:MAG: CocE/NonD family hydrolase [Polyangiaceae bacterium]
MSRALERVGQRVLGGAAAMFDRAATWAAYAQSARARRRNSSESFSHEHRIALLGRLQKRYREVLGGDDYFREARAIDPEVRPAERARASPETDVVDVRWPSDYETYLHELSERYHSKVDNRRAAARLFLHPRPRPMVILVHGYMAGQYEIEQRMWPIAWLQRLGFDVALFVLPFHGVRAIRGRSGPPPFPNSDPRLSNEGFRQAMADLRDFIAWLRDRGHPSVGMMGMSLGGYTTALAATLESELSFAVPIIPLASLADFASDQGRLGREPNQRREQRAALDRAHRVISPLHRPLSLDSKRVLVVGASADRITPIAHAQKLAGHFRAPLHRWYGGHLLQLGRGDAFREIGRLLRSLDLVDSCA